MNDPKIRYLIAWVFHRRHKIDQFLAGLIGAVIIVLLFFLNGCGQTADTTTTTTTTTSTTTTTTFDLWGCASFNDSNTGIAVGSNGTIIKTTDGGTNWAAKTSGTSQTLFQFVSGSGSNNYISGAGGTILKSLDAGDTWSSQTSGTSQDLYSIDFRDDLGLAVGGNGVILKTTDGGTTWSAKTSGTTEILRGVAIEDNSIAWAAGDNGVILKSIDTGESWVAQNGGTTQDIKYFDAWSSTFAFGTGANGLLVYSLDSGGTWTSAEGGDGTYYRLIAKTGPPNDYWIIGSNGLIKHSTDPNWIIWSTQTSGTTNNLYGISMFSATTGWAVGANRTILRTTDGGTTWTAQTF